MSERESRTLPWFGVPKLMPYLRPYLKGIAVMIAVGCLVSLIDAVYPMFNRYALDHFVIGRSLDGIKAVEVRGGPRAHTFHYDCGVRDRVPAGAVNDLSLHRQVLRIEAQCGKSRKEEKQQFLEFHKGYCLRIK